MLVCLPLAAPTGLSPLHMPTLCGSERVLVVSTGGGRVVQRLSTPPRSSPEYRSPPPALWLLEAPVRKIILQMHTPARSSQCWSRQTPAWTRSVHLDAPGQRHGQQPVSGTADPQSRSSGGSVDTTKTRSGQNEQWREANRRRQRQTNRYRGLVPTPPPPASHSSSASVSTTVPHMPPNADGRPGRVVQPIRGPMMPFSCTVLLSDRKRWYELLPSTTVHNSQRGSPSTVAQSSPILSFPPQASNATAQRRERVHGKGSKWRAANGRRPPQTKTHQRRHGKPGGALSLPPERPPLQANPWTRQNF